MSQRHDHLLAQKLTQSLQQRRKFNPLREYDVSGVCLFQPSNCLAAGSIDRFRGTGVLDIGFKFERLYQSRGMIVT